MSGEDRKPHREGFTSRCKPDTSSVADDEYLMGEDIGDDDVFYDDDVCIDDENDSTLNGNSSLEDDSTPIVEVGSSVEEEGTSIAEDKPATLQGKDPKAEEKGPTEEEDAASDEQSPTEKKCQTVDQGVVYKLVQTTEEEDEPIEELPSAKQDEKFFDKGCQTNSIAEYKPRPIMRDVPITLGFERSSSSSSLNATGYDSGNTLKDCPSIGEEPSSEPVEGVLLKITAQVMTRSDSTGGWIPEGSGGISVVTITKIETPRKPGDEGKTVNKYMVRGRMVSNNRVTLTCHLSEKFEYNKVMPTFHHWKSDGKKFGLTFFTNYEAKSFDRVLRETVYAYALELDPNATPIKAQGDGEEEFLVLTQPVESKSETPSPPPNNDPPPETKRLSEEEEKIQFMQLTSLPEYFYVERRSKASKENERLRRRPLHRVRKPVRLFGRVRRETRLRCKHCYELFEEEDNRRGQCRYAPSRMRNFINHITCMKLVRVWGRNCMLDQEYVPPCTCRNDGHRGIRWFGLCVLSFFFPCMMLYPLLKGCYNCGVYCGVCGGRHEQRSETKESPQEKNVVYY